MDIFQQAVKTGLTFSTSRGNRLPQEIYQLPLTGNNGFNLDEISRVLLATIRSTEEESLVSKSKTDPEDLLRLSILKAIIADKKEDARLVEQTAMRTRRKSELMAMIADKETKADKRRSVEDLYAELAALED